MNVDWEYGSLLVILGSNSITLVNPDGDDYDENCDPFFLGEILPGDFVVPITYGRFSDQEDYVKVLTGVGVGYVSRFSLCGSAEIL